LVLLVLADALLHELGPRANWVKFQTQPILGNNFPQCSNSSEDAHVLHAFIDGTDGGYPTAGVVLDNAGNVYGTSKRGGDMCSEFPDGCGGHISARCKQQRV